MTNNSTIAGDAKANVAAGSMLFEPPLQCSWQRPGWSGSMATMSVPAITIACAQGMPAMEAVAAMAESTGGIDCIAQA